jgi:Tol biopolymer transport system component
LVVVELATGETSLLVDDGADARSPSWCAATGELFYVSDAGGEDEVWMMDLQGRPARVTSGGGKAYPAVSPAGDRIACLVDGQGLLLLDRKSGDIARIPAPVGVAYPPAWHPDGHKLAVTANDWGSWDIYFVDVDSGVAIVVTRHRARDMFPAWHPSGSRLALVSERSGEMQLWEIEGLSAHLQRLESPPPTRVLQRPPARGAIP